METVGLLFDAGGADQYLSTLSQVAAAESKVASAADPAVSAVNALDDTLGGADKAAASFAEMSQMAAANAAKFGAQADTAAADAAVLGKSADKAAGGVDDLGDAAKQGGKATDQLGDDAQKGGKGLSFLQEMAIGAARKVGELLVNAAQQAGQAIVRFLGESIDKAGDFEQQMNRFASVTGDALDESGQSLDDFKELFISLGRELPVSTADVQQAAIEMAKGGIEPATIAAGGLRDVLNLAAAGEVGIAEAAEIASKQLGVWSSASDTAAQKAAFLTQTSNLLAQAANASTVDVDDLALGLANAGGIAKTSGLSFRETVTTMALISSGFSSAADAGTSFKTFLTSLRPKSDAAAASMKELGLLTADGTSKFYDASGSFIGMNKAAGLLHDSLDGLSQAQKTAALQTIFGNDAFRAAAMLAERGAEGYAAMAEDMAKAGSAAAQAAKKQQGFNVAIDNMQGSLEAFQITVGTAVLPLLTKLVNGLASGINAITDYADATIKGETFLAQLAGTVQKAVVPAIEGVTAALLVYATVNSAQLLPGLVKQGLTLALNTAEWIANGVAVAAAMAPYAAIGLTVGAVLLKFQEFNQSLKDATTQLLESKAWWQASALAIEDYNTQIGDSKKALEPYAATITELRTEIEADTEALGRHMVAGKSNYQTSAQFAAQIEAERQAIEAKKNGLVQVTDAYNKTSQAMINATAEGITATNVTTTLADKIDALGTQASLTEEDLKNLTKAIQDNSIKGQEAIQQYATSYSEFTAGVEQRASDHAQKIADLEAQKQKATTQEQKKGLDDQIAQVNQSYHDQETAAAQSYARQQAAQTQHLGQMLIDYTVARAELGQIEKNKAAEITDAIAKEYGIQENQVAGTYLRMTDSIDKFSHEAGGDINNLIGDLRDQQHQAASTQKAMDDYAKEYVATQTNNFLDGKQDAESYIHSLESIPKEITTTVTTIHKEEKGGDSADIVEPTHRAGGGSLSAGDAYLVGEQGPEIITAGSGGYVTPTDAVRRALPSMAQLSSLFGGSGRAASQTVINVDARGSSLTVADIARGVQAGLAAEGRQADVLVRTGAF